MGDEEYLEASGWQLDSKFPEVSAQQLQNSDWQVVRQDRWKRSEHIVHLEARALVKSMEAVVHDCSAFDSRQLLLVDSMSAALAFDRCRSRNYRLLRQIRKFCSYAIGCNLSFSVRWIPSEINPADEPSRVFDIYHAHGQHSNRSFLRASVSRDGAEKGFHTDSTSFPDIQPSFSVTDSGHSSAEGCSSVQFQVQDVSAGQAASSSPATEASQHREGPAGARGREDGNIQTEKETFRKRRQHLILRGASESQSTADVGKAQQKAPEKVCRRNDAIRTPRAEPVRAQGHHCQDRAVLQPGVWGAEGIHQRSQTHFFDGSLEGCGDQCLFQPSLFGRSSSPQGRKDSSFVHASEPGLQPVWITETASDLSGFEGVEKAEPRHFPQSMAVSSVVRSGQRNEKIGSAADGSFYHAGAVFLFQAKRALEVPGVFTGATCAVRDRALVLAAEPRGASCSVKDRHIRRLSCPRLSLSQALVSTAYASTDQPAEQPDAVGFRLWPVCQSLWPNCQTKGHRHHPLSASALRSKYRSKPKLQVPTGGAETRKVEITQECGPIRKVRTISSELPDAPSGLATALPGRRVTSRGSDVGPGPRSKTAFTAKGLKGQYVADLFSGHGGVAHQCRQLGYAAKEWELCRGSQFDLTKPSVLSKLKRDVQQRLVLAVMLAPPYSSFSTARDRTCVIRNEQYPWGLPEHLLPPADQQQVQNGNACFRAAIQIIKWLNALLENPASSKCWLLPQLQKFEASSCCTVVFTDFCQFGTLWKKRTKFLCGNLDSQDVARIGRLCQGKGICSRTQKKHFQLSGSNHQGVPWTRVAQLYPAQLCKQLAFALTAPTHYSPTTI